MIFYDIPPETVNWQLKVMTRLAALCVGKLKFYWIKQTRIGFRGMGWDLDVVADKNHEFFLLENKL